MLFHDALVVGILFLGGKHTQRLPMIQCYGPCQALGYLFPLPATVADDLNHMFFLGIFLCNQCTGLLPHLANLLTFTFCSVCVQCIEMGVSENSGTPKCMVCNGNPY